MNRSEQSREKARRQAPALSARAGILACCWMLSGCGGGEEGKPPETQTAKAEVPSSAPNASSNPSAAEDSSGPSPAETDAAVGEAMTLFAAGTPSQTERDRLRGLLAQAIRRDDNPLAHFYYAECLRPEAASNLAVEMYERYHKAAVGKVPEAAFRVGVCLETGMGPPIDLVQAMNWYRFAAEEGIRPAQMALAHAYHTGSGVPQSDQAAFTWLLLAGGLQDASLLRDSILRGLDAAQMRAAVNTAPAFVNYQVSLEFR